MRRLPALLTLLCASAFAQEFRGTILGRVTDPSGAVLTTAKITIANEETGAKLDLRSNAEGNYTAPFLLPGSYTVSVESPGFRKSVQSKVIVQVNDRIALNFTLEIGSAGESVTVKAESPQLQTSSADMGQVVDRQFLDRLPVSGRSVLDFADMAPGVQAGGGGFPGITSNSQNNITVNGGNGTNAGNDISIDGIPALAPRQLGLAVGMPMSDAVQEFKIETTMFDATLGHSNGGAMAITTRSGTNEYHGTGYYVTTNQSLNASTWANNRAGIPKPALTRYAVGVTVGGPVRLPKYDGHNRTFFFFGFEKDLNESSSTGLARTPTALEKAGDFSQTLAPGGAPIVIYDPFSTAVNANGAFVSRTPFSGARIPQNRLSPIGLAVLSKSPDPSLSVPAQIGLPNWTASTQITANVRNWVAKVDQQLGSKQHVFVRAALPYHLQGPTPAYFPGSYNVPPGGTSGLNTDLRHQKSAAVDDTVIFSPSFLGSFRGGYTRLFSLNRMDGDGLDPAELKLPPAITGRQIGVAWPIFDISADGAAFIGSRPRQSVNDVWTGMATLTKLRGNHSFRFGVDYRLVRWNENNPGEQANGQFIFNNSLTRSNPTTASTGTTSGSAMASLLLGLPATTGNSRLGSVSALSLQTHYMALFLQDDYKITRTLTLNLGLRYEMETPSTERYDRLLSGLDSSIDLHLTVPGLGPLRGGATFVNDSGTGRRQGNIDANNFGPRVGFAWSATQATVLRGGYGLFYSSAITNLPSGTPGTDASFGATTQYVGSSGGEVSLLPGVSLSNPFPNGYVQPTGKSLGVLTDLGGNVSFISPNRALPYVQQWQFSLQRQLPWQTLGEVAYVGAHSIGLYEDFNLDETPDTGLSNLSTIANPFLGLLPATSTLGQGATIRTTKLGVRFPQFNAVTMQRNNSGRNLYHGLQMRVQKRMSGGLHLVANYTFSKSLLYNAYSAVNERRWRTVSPVDRSHMFRIFATYELPVGRGRAVGRTWPGWLDRAIGGWALTWVTRYTSGEPLSISDTGGRPIPTRNPLTPGSVGDRLGDQINRATGRPVNPFIDPTAFIHLPDFKITPEPPQYGWLRGPSSLAHNATLFKTIDVYERWKLELRAEIAGPFNSPIFGNPNTNLATPSAFGVINSASGSRNIMFGAKIRF